MLRFSRFISLILALLLCFTMVIPTRTSFAGNAAADLIQAATQGNMTGITDIENKTANAGVSGLPDSPQFGYGARLYVNGQAVQPAIETAAAMGLDWLAMDFDWAARWVEPNTAADMTTLNQVMDLAQHNHMNVLLTIKNAPAWSLTPTGPDPIITANIVLMLAHQFRGTLMAIELFPGVNTKSGWGAPANPTVYTALLKTVQSVLRANGETLVIVSGGLTPLSTVRSNGDMDDLSFLEGLYAAGAQSALSIIGLRFSTLSGEPMAEPTPSNRRVLRHYEEIRRIMLKNNHDRGLIWITDFTWPDHLTTTNQQARWAYQAYKLLIAQLYIGAAFFGPLNPASLSSKTALIAPDGQLHPALNSISQTVITIGQPAAAASFLSKKKSPTCDFKHPNDSQP